MRTLPMLLMFLVSGAALRAEEETTLLEITDTGEFSDRFNAGVGRIRFVAIVSPG